ncbi:hypothetical protein ACH4C6_34995 [Streptomyces sp. NPDC017943]
MSELSVPVVCTFGFSAHTVAKRQNWDIHRDPRGDFAASFLGSPYFSALVRATVRGTLAF